jgi:hypothetical protein
MYGFSRYVAVRSTRTRKEVFHKIVEQCEDDAKRHRAEHAEDKQSDKIRSFDRRSAAEHSRHGVASSAPGTRTDALNIAFIKLSRETRENQS